MYKMLKYLIIFTLMAGFGVITEVGAFTVAPCHYSINNSELNNSEMKTINLSQSKVALVDDSDFESLNAHKWCAAKDGNTFYAARTVRADGKQTTVKMQWEIMGRKWIDHIDRNGLNNQKDNLRFCTHQENQMNQRRQKNTSSIYKGVTWYKRERKWRARIMINGKDVYLGLFTDEVDAGKAYDVAAFEHFGEFANLNEC